jgi:3-oxoacyl-[acyl-carrier protein] reductase
MNTLKNKTVVITGGYGQVGRTVAKRLAFLGATVVLLVRSRVDKAESFVLQLSNKELKHRVIQADVTDSNSLKLAVEKISHCDVLINCASITQNVDPNNLNELTDEVFDSIVTTNLRGVYASIREFIELLRQSEDGLIINITSTAGMRSGPSNLAYAASKAGVDLLSKSLSSRLAPDVRIISIAPGMLEQGVSGSIATAEKKNFMINTTPMQRIATADDIADTVEAYATKIKFATGCVVLLDGGRTV